jgi:hypothetical protein
VHEFPCRVNPEAEGSITTGEDGKFVLSVRKSGVFYLYTAHEGFALWEKGPIPIDHRTGLEGITVNLVKGGALLGRVWMPPGRDPAGVIVALSRGDPFPESQRTHTDGTFRFENLTPGRWQVERREKEITGIQYMSTKDEDLEPPTIPWVCYVEEGKTTRHDLDLTGGTKCLLKGRLTLDGVAPAGWEAQLLTADSARRKVLQECPLDLEGGFILTTQTPGAYCLLLTSMESGSSKLSLVDRLELTDGETVWNADLATGWLELRSSIPVDKRTTKIWHRWKGPDHLEASTEIHLEPALESIRFRVPAGSGRIIRLEKAASKERIMEDVLAEVEVSAGESVTIQLD